MPRAKKERPPAETPCKTAPGGCEIGELFRVLGKTHMLDIVHLFLYDGGPRRFVEVQDRLRLSPNTLTERLKELVEVGLLTRTAYNEIPPRVDYEATTKARNLFPVFQALQEWAAKNDLRPMGPTGEKAASVA
jgi:DNA-binding HxlR family transcriptional regulator